MNGNVIRIIYNMYDQAKSCVKYDQSISAMFSCNVGVRQGENLSPLLFSVYLNDLERYVSQYYKGLDLLNVEVKDVLSDDDVEVFLRLYVLLYADDTIVLSESAEDLQLALTGLHDYCVDWHITVNTLPYDTL